MDILWDKLDVITYSWQKVLGGEGGHGILILSPRAIERLNNYKPNVALPKIFKLVKNNKVDKSIFEGNTINTPSMLCVEDYISALEWVEKIGGVDETIKRSNRNLRAINSFIKEHS